MASTILIEAPTLCAGGNHVRITVKKDGAQIASFDTMKDSSIGVPSAQDVESAVRTLLWVAYGASFSGAEWTAFRNAGLSIVVG